MAGRAGVCAGRVPLLRWEEVNTTACRRLFSLGCGADTVLLLSQANCGQGVGAPGQGLPSAYHDMIDQSSYTFAVVGGLAGAGEPQALSYWAVSDVFEESFFPVHNESCECSR